MCVSYAKADIINYIVIRSEFAFDNRMGISDLKTIAIEYISAVQKRENSKQIFEEETHTQQKGEGPTIQ